MTPPMTERLLIDVRRAVRLRAPRRAIRLAGAIGLVVAIIGLATGAGARPAHADTPGFYNMTSAANTVSLEVDMANVPLLAPQLLFLSPGTAQAQLDSFGDSTAYAGAPFVGQTVEGVGGLVSGLGSGVLPPIPTSLPGYIQTSNPASPSVDDSQGPYTLRGSSTPNSSTATAGIAAVAGQPSFLSSTSTATTSYNTTTGELTSTAQSITEPFAIGALVQIGTIQATATMDVDQNGNLTKSSSLDLGSITVAGIKIGLTQNGLELLGQNILVPSLSALDTLLASSGVSLKLVPATETATSVTSEGLQITLSKNIPVEGATALIITIGQANAQLQYGLVAAPAGSPGDTTSPLTPLTPFTGALGTSTPSFSAPAGSASSTPVLPSTSGSTAPVTSATSAEPQSSGGTETVAPSMAALADRVGPDALRWYFILALAGIALTLTSRTAGALAVRRTGRTTVRRPVRSSKGTP